MLRSFAGAFKPGSDGYVPELALPVYIRDEVAVKQVGR